MLGNPKIINMVRDPRAAIQSHLARFKKEIPWVCKLWNASVENAASLYDFIPKDSKLDVRFEDLVTAPIEKMKEICGFIGIDFDPAMLEVESVHISYSLEKKGVAVPTQTSGFDRKTLEKWRKLLRPSQIRFIQESCRKGMQRHDYKFDSPDVSPIKYFFFNRFQTIKHNLLQGLRRVRGTSVEP